jgi:oligopeptide transport system permease protein
MPDDASAIQPPPPDKAASPKPPPAAGNSPWREAAERLKQNKMALAAVVILALLGVLCALAPWIAPYSYYQTDFDLGASPPSRDHWLGTDQLGRDLFTRILYGGRISFLVGLCATFVSLFIGVFYGAIAGYRGGRIDSFMMRAVDILYSLPFTVFVILLTVLFGRSLILLFLAIGAVEWLTMARIVRGQVLSLKSLTFIEAANVLGLSRWRILRHHLIPNAIGPIIVYTTLTIPSVMLLEAFLSFLGLGVQPPMSSWGILIKEGSEAMEQYPWLLIFPSLVFALTLFCLNFLGDGLRDALDPRSTRR